MRTRALLWRGAPRGVSWQARPRRAACSARARRRRRMRRAVALACRRGAATAFGSRARRRRGRAATPAASRRTARRAAAPQAAPQAHQASRRARAPCGACQDVMHKPQLCDRRRTTRAARRSWRCGSPPAMRAAPETKRGGPAQRGHRQQPRCRPPAPPCAAGRRAGGRGRVSTALTALGAARFRRSVWCALRGPALGREPSRPTAAYRTA